MDLIKQSYLVKKTGLTKQSINKAFKANHFTLVKDKGRLKIDHKVNYFVDNNIYCVIIKID